MVQNDPVPLKRLILGAQSSSQLIVLEQLAYVFVYENTAGKAVWWSANCNDKIY